MSKHRQIAPILKQTTQTGALLFYSFKTHLTLHSHIGLGLHFGQFPSRLQPKIVEAFIFYRHMHYMPCQFHHLGSDQRSSSLFSYQPASSNFLPLSPGNLPQQENRFTVFLVVHLTFTLLILQNLNNLQNKIGLRFVENLTSRT